MGQVFGRKSVFLTVEVSDALQSVAIAWRRSLAFSPLQDAHDITIGKM